MIQIHDFTKERPAAHATEELNFKSVFLFSFSSRPLVIYRAEGISLSLTSTEPARLCSCANVVKTTITDCSACCSVSLVEDDPFNFYDDRCWREMN